LTDAEASLAIDESYTKGFLRRSMALSALGRPAHAEETLKSGLEKFPDDDTLTKGMKDFYLEDDGDQSKLRGILPGSPAQNMRDLQRKEGLLLNNYDRLLQEVPHHFFRACYLGNFKLFKKIYNPVLHSGFRCFNLKLPITSVLKAGAQRLGSCVIPDKRGKQWSKILKFVLEKGWCRVDAKDIAGYTALGHATGRCPALELAKILLEHGADPNSRDRMGATPLFGAIFAQDTETTELLIDAGADPKLADYEGCAAEQFAATTAPRILAVIREKMRINQENRVVVPGGNCSNSACGRSGAARMCVGCHRAIYCSRDCQRQAWKQHKKVCIKVGGGGGASASAS
jgi:MYND finger/Ankyrin repeats (3 copies)